MKYVKSFLALAFAALFGTAAQASMIVANDLGDTRVTIRQKSGGDGSKDYIADVTMKVGEKVVLQLKSDKSTKGYTPTVVDDQPTLWTATLSEAEIPEGGSVDLTIEALKATTSTQTLLYYKDAAAVTETDATPVEINITITDSVIRESFSIENGSATNLTLSGSAATDSWTAEVTSGSEVEVSPASYTGANFELTINALAETETPATVTVQKNGEDFAIYTVTVTKGPDFVMFMGQKIFYSNATTNMVSGELLLTFTNTAAAGTFKLPKDFDARVLVVGGGAGGVATVGSSGGAALSGNGGRAGRVLEKKLSDDFTLSAGTYEITVGAGGSANEPSDDSTNASFVGGNGGSPSSLVGAGIDLSAKGGKAWATSGKPSKLAEDNDPKGPGNADSGVRTKDTSNSYTSWSGRGAGMPDGEDFDEYDHNPLGYDSDITGETVTYGVGGAGTNCTYASASRSEAKTGVTAQPNTGNGGGGASMNANSGAGGSGIVIVRLFSKNYTITTVADPVEGGTVTGGGEYAPDAEATLTATANEGYSFAKWQDDNTENPRTITVTADVEYTATFTGNVYTVTLEKNGGACTDLSSYTYGVGAALPADVTKTSLTFGGWYTNATFAGDAWTAIGTTETGDKEFWAKWNAVFTIQVPENVNLTTVTNAQGTVIVPVGDTYTIPEGTSVSIVYTVKDGYKFVGNTTEYVQNVTPVNGEVKSTAPKTVDSQYDVTLEKNGGTCTDLTTYEYGVVTQLPSDATKTGYAFGGWYTNETFLGEAWTEIGKDETGDKTFWAKWTANAYTVAFDANAGEGEMEPMALTYDVETNLTANAFVKTGYSFAGWTNAADEVVYADKALVSNLTATAGATVTLYAKWTNNWYTLTLAASPAEGGSVTGAGTYAFETSVEIEATANPNYNFLGWYSDNVRFKKSAKAKVIVSKDTYCVAKFEPILVTVTPAEVENATATVYTNGVPVTGSPIQVVTNAAFEIVYETDGDHMFSDLTTVKTNKFTATENPTTDPATFVVVGRVAQIGDVKYTSINEAFATLTNNVGHDVTVKILRGFDEVLTADYSFKNNVTITTDVEGGVTVDLGFREGKDMFGIDENLPGTLTITENVTIKGLGQLVSGYGTLNNVVNIAGDLTAGQVWAYKSIVNVLPTAKVVATYGEGDVSINYSGTINVEGTGTNEVQVQGISLLGLYKGDKTFVLSNTFVKVQCLTNDYKSGSFTLNLDSARFEADGDKGMDFGTVSANTINMTADSFIATSNLTNLTTLNIDATGLEGAVKVIDILGSQAMELKDFGTVTVTGGGEAYVVDNDLWVKAKPSAIEIEVPTAVSGLTYNGNVQTGVLAGVGYTITDNEARNAGYHFAMAKLEEGYVWKGGSEEDQQINWSIDRKEIALTPDEGQSIIFGKPYTITYKTDVELAEGDTFTGELKPSSEEESDIGANVLIIIGSLEIVDGNDGQNYQLDFNKDVEIHIYAASQGVNPTGSDPITVDTEWILKNLPDVDPENEGEVSEAMAVDCPEPNNNPLWVNYILNTDTNESIRVVSSQSLNGVVFDLNSLGIRPDSGATVHAKVEFTDAEGVPSTVFEDKELPISITGITESGIYTVSFWIKNEEEESITDVTVGNNEVGALVKDGYKSGSARELVSVPWSDLASEDGDITVENFLVTANLAAGTKLYSLAEGGEYYDAWELSEDKKWMPVKTVKIVDGVVTVQESDTADKATLKCGTGVWVERADASSKLVFIGATTDEQPKFTPADGWILGSVRGFEPFNLNTMVNDAHVGDQVMEPTASGTPKVYTYDSTGWGYDEVINDGDIADIKRVRDADKLKLPAGSGFWFYRKAEEPK